MDVSDLTLSVVSHGHGDMLCQLLRELDAQPSLNGARVIVTLNLAMEPFDPTGVRGLSLTVVRNSVPRGFGANHNSAFASCRSRWFVVLNPDLRLAGVEPFNSLARMAKQIENVGVVAPAVINGVGVLEDSVRTNLTPWSIFARNVLGRRVIVDARTPSRRGTPYYWLAGMCLLFEASAFRAVGGFDERFVLYCEDYDICARLYGAGYASAVDSSVQIVHDAQRDSHRSRSHLGLHLSSLMKVWTSRAFWVVTIRNWTGAK
jgi:N-acetylglucosaminyl-diphospho-decaprenol L-rhamnosyltransferase